MICDFVQATAKDGVNLEGLVFVPEGGKVDAVGVWIHGLGSNFHRSYGRTTKLAKLFNDSGIAFATFDTRGHDVIAHSVRSDKRKKKGYRGITIGAAYERFEDSALDLDAIVDFLKKRFKKIFLLGHSTGANKAVYYLAREREKVDGGALISPVSDVPMIKKELGSRYDEAINVAKNMIKRGDGDKLVPEALCANTYTAKRLLSLASGESTEQLFPNKSFRGPLRIFSKIKTPIIVIYAEMDDYLALEKVSAQDLIGSFAKFSKSKKFESFIGREADHSFTDCEEELGEVLINWIKSL